MDFSFLVAVIIVHSNNKQWLFRELCLSQDKEAILFWFLDVHSTKN